MNPKDSTLKVPSIHANSRLKRCSTVLLYTYCTCTFVPFIDKSFVAYSTRTCTRTVHVVRIYFCTFVQRWYSMHNCTCSPTFHCKYERTCACTRSRVPSYEGTTNPYLASYVNMYLRILLSSKISSYLRTKVQPKSRTTY